jgi:hypothetical protein
MSEHERLELATESTMARAITRIGVPALLTVIAVLGGAVLADIRASVNAIDARSLRQGTEIQAVGNKVELLNTKVDHGLIWRLTELERRVNTMDREAERRPR